MPQPQGRRALTRRPARPPAPLAGDSGGPIVLNLANGGSPLSGAASQDRLVGLTR